MSKKLKKIVKTMCLPDKNEVKFGFARQMYQRLNLPDKCMHRKLVLPVTVAQKIGICPTKAPKFGFARQKHRKLDLPDKCTENCNLPVKCTEILDLPDKCTEIWICPTKAPKIVICPTNAHT
jgi:hypothetical protein